MVRVICWIVMMVIWKSCLDCGAVELLGWHFCLIDCFCSFE